MERAPAGLLRPAPPSPPPPARARGRWRLAVCVKERDYPEPQTLCQISIVWSNAIWYINIFDKSFQQKKKAWTQNIDTIIAEKLILAVIFTYLGDELTIGKKSCNCGGCFPELFQQPGAVPILGGPVGPFEGLRGLLCSYTRLKKLHFVYVCFLKVNTIIRLNST